MMSKSKCIIITSQFKVKNCEIFYDNFPLLIERNTIYIARVLLSKI